MLQRDMGKIPEEALKTEVIYEDKSIMVCYKPAGLAVQTAKIGRQDMVSELKNHLAQSKTDYDGYLGIIHRLDQPVEGLLVFAKQKGAAANLSNQLKEGVLNKDYYAVVCGNPFKMEDTLTDYLAKTPDNRAVVSQEGKQRQNFSNLKYQKAVLHYKLTEMSLSDLKTDMDGTKLFLAEIHIETGRFHQIRAQMSNAGLPLLGDRKYGNDMSVTVSAKLHADHVALCAYHLTFVHPVSHKSMEFHIKPRAEIFHAKPDIRL